MRTLSFLVVFALGCAPARGPAPVTQNATHEAKPLYRAVHFDTLAKDRFRQFENARKEWVGVLRRVNGSDLRGAYYEAEGVGFLGVRTFSSFTDLDTRAKRLETTMASVPKADGDRYDAACDSALVFPHVSEIWRLDEELAYAPKHGARLDESSAGFFVLSAREVKADAASETQFWEGEKDILRALADVDFPLTRLTFETVYGSGRIYSLWLAPSREAFSAAPSIEQALVAARGAEAAAALRARVDAVVLEEKKLDVIRRRDLDSPF